MADRQYQYDAFISYRHTDPDKFVAENLHKQLESFRLPKSISKRIGSGKKRIERVFRDQEELPLTANLEETLVEALRKSEWLIVICSPRYLESAVCRKELETFLEFHGRSRVLTVLAEGKPSEVFPPQLLSEMEVHKLPNGVMDETSVVMTPLAADVRGRNHREILKKMKTEKLRLMAPIFGVEYDDLRQRHRERKLKRLLAASLIGGAACLLFGIYSMINANIIRHQKERIEEQALDIQAQNEQLAYSQALFLAEESMEYMTEGNRSEAVKTAVMALTEYEGVDMPYTPEAQFALVNSLRVYDIGVIAKAQYQIETLSKIDSINVSSDRDTLAILDSGMNFNVFNLDTQEYILELAPGESGIQGAYAYDFLGDDKIVFITANEGFTDKVCVYDLCEKEILATIEAECIYSVCCDEKGNYIALNTGGESYIIYDGNTYERLGATPELEGSDRWKLTDIDENGVLTCVMNTEFGTEGEKNTIYFIDLKTMEIVNSKEFAGQSISGVSCREGIAYIASNNWDAYGEYKDSYLCAMDINTSEILWMKEHLGQKFCMMELPGNEGGTDLIYVTENMLYLYTMSSGELLFADSIPGKVLEIEARTHDNSYKVFCDNGEVYGAGAQYGFLINNSYRLECASEKNEACCHTPYGIVMLAKDDNRVTIYTEETGPDIKVTDDNTQLPEDTCLSGKYEYNAPEVARSYGLEYPELAQFDFCSDDGKLGFVFYTNGNMYVYDIENDKLLNMVENMPRMKWYLGQDKYGYTYIFSDSNGCYVLDEQMKPAMYIAGVVGADFDAGTVRIGWYDDEYEAPLYTVDELIKIAEETYN